MSALTEPIGPQEFVEDPTPEALTAKRRRLNTELQDRYGRPPTGPTQREIDWYTSVGRTPPTD